MYYRPTGGKLEIIDSTNEPFLHKHGNGRICRGVDEAIHTMNVGGRRRAIIPPNLGSLGRNSSFSPFIVLTLP